MGRYATARSALQFIFTKRGGNSKAEDWEKKCSRDLLQKQQRSRPKKCKFGREKGPGGRTCNAAATWALKDLSSKTNFLANRGTAEKTTDFQP